MATKTRTPKAPNVLRKVKLDGRWMMLPVAKRSSAQDADYDWSRVMLRGRPIPVFSGTFYFEFREAGGKVRRAVSDEPKLVAQQWMAQKSVLRLRAMGVEVEDAPLIQERQEGRAKLPGPLIADVIGKFTKSPPVRLRDKSISKYKEALESFQEWTDKTHACQVDRDEILAFMEHMVHNQKLAPGTAKDKAVIVRTTFERAGVTITMKRGDWPQENEEQPEVYTLDQLDAIFRVMRFDEYVRYQTFLQTGYRKQEIQHMAWLPDFQPKDKTVRVTRKPQFGFEPKNYQERITSIPEALVELLLKHQLRQDEGTFLMFGTSSRNLSQGKSGDLPDDDHLDKLKKIALRGYLNCGHCEGIWGNAKASCKDKPICRMWTLHKFRHTYATAQLRDGFDIVSVQKMLGHKDVNSTMRYVRALADRAIAERIDNTALARLIIPR